MADPFTAGLTIDNGATLRFATGFNSYPGRGILIGTGGAVFDEGAGITQFLNGPFVNVSGQGGGFTKVGTGTQGLGGTNTFTGDVSLNGGVLSISRDANLGASSNAIYLNNGTTLRIEDGLNNYGGTPATPVLATFSTSRQFTLVSGNDTIEVKNFADTNTSFGFGGAPIAPASHLNTLTIDGLLTGAGTLVKEGNGTLVLTNTSNNYTGGTIINAGTLSVSNPSELGLDSTGLAINNNAVYQATASFGSARTVTLGGTGGPAGVGGGTFDVLAALTETQTGVVQGTGSLSKSGAGALFLGAGNTYSGGTFITGGILEINTDASLGAATGGVDVGNGTLEVLSSITTTRSFALSNAASTVQVDGNSTYEISNAVTGSGNLSKTGSGILNLFGANTYSGTTTINSGTIAINTSSSLGSGAGAVTVGAGILDATSTLTSNHSIILSSATSTIQVDPGQTLTNNGGISGAGDLNKTGTGTLVLTGAGTYTGNTRITAGTIVAAAGAGSAFGGTSALNIEAGATFVLGASNQINDAAPINLSGGTFVNSGFSEGSASAAGMGTLNLTGNSVIDFGSGPVGTLTFTSFNPLLNYLTIDNWTGTLNTIGTASTDRLIFSADPTANLMQFIFSGYAGATALSLGNGFFEVTPAAVPEMNPGLFAALLCAGLGFLAHRREIRRRASRS